MRLLQHKVASVSGWGRCVELWRPLAAIMIVVGLARGCGHIATAVATAAVAPSGVTDDLNDWSKVWSHSPNLTFDTNTANFAGDPSHVSRTQPTAEWIIWKLPGLSAFRALTYFWPSEPVSPFSLLTSSDGLTWTPATPTITAGPRAGWTPYTYTLTPPSGSAYVKMVWNNLSGQASTPQIGQVILSATLASTPPPTSTATATNSPAPPTSTTQPGSGPIFFVSKNGNNTTGSSWATAWRELDQINWSLVTPGSTIYIDGGAPGGQMVYTTMLTVSRSGTANAPITISLSSQSGHNGQAVVFGGRTTPLPYCGQAGYVAQVSATPSWAGINVGAAAWITVDGTRWRGIAIHGQTPTTQHSWEAFGVYLDQGSSHITLRNLEIYDNGIASTQGADEPIPSGTVAPDDPGIRLAGDNLLFDRLIIHDDGQDALQSPGINGPARIQNSWFYNSRQNPLQPQGVAFNSPCTHQDGVQIYSGGVQAASMSLTHMIFGPGLMQGLNLSPGNGSVQNVSVSDALFINAQSNALLGSPAQYWTMDHITSFQTPSSAQGQSASNFYLDGSGFAVSGSIIYGGNVHLPSGTAGANNCQWQTSGAATSALSGQTISPQFTSPVDRYPSTTSLDQLMVTDFSRATTSPCAGLGASLTSGAQLLAQ